MTFRWNWLVHGGKLAVLVISLDSSSAADKPYGYHLVNNVLHCAASLLFYYASLKVDC